MGIFVKHSPCPKCGSRDNLATYSDGSGHCFGCGFHPKPTTSPYVELNDESNTTQSIRRERSLPEDDSTEYGLSAVKWAESFGISVAELLARCVSYSRKEDRLFFNFYDADGTRILSQARNFNPMAKSKYYTIGKTDNCLPIYYAKEQGGSKLPVLVITEDCLSAIKIARQSDAMPALSSDLPLAKLNRLARLYGAFLVWLDGDMFHKAQRIARRLQLLGCEAQAVYTPLDPKCYDDATIRNVLLTGKLESC